MNVKMTFEFGDIDAAILFAQMAKAAVSSGGNMVDVTNLDSKAREVFASRPLADVPLAAAVAPSQTAPEAPKDTSVPPAPKPAPTEQPAAAIQAPAGSAIDLDVTGLPWDERIHAGTRAKNKDGTWRVRRGVQGTLVKKVEEELRARSAAPPSADVVAPAAAAAPPPPAAPAAVPPPPPAPQAALTFGNVVARIHAGLQSAVLTQTKLAVTLQEKGVATLQDLAKRPDLFELVLKELGV